MNLKKCYQCSGNIEISLDLKVYFFLVTCKINNLIALRSTNQITEISAPWWLEVKFGEDPLTNFPVYSIDFKFMNLPVMRNWIEWFWRICQDSSYFERWILIESFRCLMSDRNLLLDARVARYETWLVVRQIFL